MTAIDLGAEWMRHMRRGEWAACWDVSDRVLRERAGQACWHLPRHQQWLWDGSAPDERRVLVHCYHGLGDTVMFARFLPQLAARAAAVGVWAQPALLPLLRTADGIDALLPLDDGAPPDGWDLHVEVMELAHLLRATPDTVPKEPWLDAVPAPLARDGRLEVGLAWHVSDWAPERSIPLEALAPLFALPDVRWHALQRGAALARWRPGLGPVSGDDDPLVAAGVMRALDLVVTVDSFPAHLAGALGVPAWVLLPEPSDWRWMDGRTDSPWYPRARLFRQRVAGEWGAVVEEVRAGLAVLGA